MDYLLTINPMQDELAEKAIAMATCGNRNFVDTQIGDLVVKYRKSAKLFPEARIATVRFLHTTHVIVGLAIVDLEDVGPCTV